MEGPVDDRAFFSAMKQKEQVRQKRIAEAKSLSRTGLHQRPAIYKQRLIRRREYLKKLGGRWEDEEREAIDFALACMHYVCLTEGDSGKTHDPSQEWDYGVQ